MKSVKYSRYTGDELGISAEDLMRALGDYFLRSGFEQQFFDLSDMDFQNLDDLREVIREALESGELFGDQDIEKMMERVRQMSSEEIQQLVDRLTESLAEGGYITVSPSDQARRERPRENPTGSIDPKMERTSVRFQLTEQSVDFLGYKTLKDLLGSLGKASFGAHDTREMATGVETSGSCKPYEFGDNLNLDVNETLLQAIRRQGLSGPLNLEYSDLMVRQSDYQSSCATVLMLDCSHSMILYGEDRFTPAKKVALALSHLMRTQYPGDSLALVLFHDSAEEVPLSEVGARPGGSVLYEHAPGADRRPANP